MRRVVSCPDCGARTVRRVAARRLTLAAFAAGCAIASSAAFADGDDAFWVGPAAFVCMTQDAALKSTPLGAALTGNHVYDEWRQSEGEPALACIAAKRLLPDALCAALFKMDPKGDPAVARSLHEQYAQSIGGLERIGECDAPAR